MSDMTYQQMCEVAEAVPEDAEPSLCSCGRHYVGADCPATLTRTRQSIGSQLQETLDTMLGKEQIQAWSYVGRGAGSPCYDITDGYGRKGSLLPGEAVDWVNCYGYDVRFGKS